MESRWIYGVHVESMWNLWGRVKYRVDRWRHQIQDFLIIIFLWNYLRLSISNSSVLQRLKIIYNIISNSESKGGYIFCYFFRRNTKISLFWHLPLILKSSPNNTHHHELFTLLHLFLPDSYWTEVGLRQISCWLSSIQTLYPSPSGVLVNSYWNDPKSQGIADS